MIRSRPQRIVHDIRPGALLKRVVVQPRPRKEQGEGQDQAYLAMVRELPCLFCGMEPSEAAHVRLSSAAFGKASGMGKKPESKWVLPLCAQDHRLARHAQHNRGEAQFWADLGISPLIACERLYAQRGDLVAMRAVALCVIAERSAAK